LAASDSKEVLVFCALTREEGQSQKRFGQEEAQAPGNNTPSDEETIEMFHLFFWFFLLLILVLLISIYSISAIEPDLGLYQSADYVKKTPHQKWQ